MRRLLCAFLALIFCTAALSAECPIGTTPAQYIQLEYIESTGTQYIDTNTKPQADDVFEINYAATVIDTQYRAFLGAADAGYSEDFYISLYIDSGFFCNGGFTKPNINEKWKYKVELKQNTYSSLSINDSSIIIYSESYWRDDNLPVLLFARNTTQPKAIGRLYDFCWMRNNNTLVRDFIPAMRLGDGKPGMYDTVSGMFFTNQGTGEFIPGPSAGKLLGTDTDNCTPCPPNTYKDFVGDGECTPCPDTLISPSGSKSVSECGRVLHVGDKIYHMKSVKQTSPSLHIRDENGNVWYGNLYSEQE